jgi:hypothetical protein
MKPIGPLGIAMKHFGTNRAALAIAVILIVLLGVGLLI